MARIPGEGKHAHADRSQGAFRVSNGHDQGRAKSLARSCCQRRQCRQGTMRRRAPSIVHGLHDVDIQLRAGLGLNKGEPRHAPKDPLRIGCRGRTRDRTSGARHFRIARLNCSRRSSSAGTPRSSDTQSGSAKLRPETHNVPNRTEPESMRVGPQQCRCGAESPGK